MTIKAILVGLLAACVFGALYVVRIITGRNLIREFKGENLVTRTLIGIASTIAVLAFVEFIWSPYRGTTTVPPEVFQWITNERKHLQDLATKQAAIEEDRKRREDLALKEAAIEAERKRLQDLAAKQAAIEEVRKHSFDNPSSQTTVDLNGYWLGSAYQANARTRKNYTVSLTVTNRNGEYEFIAEYPELNCQGRGTLIRKSSNGVFLFRESIELGRSRCVDGTVKLKFVKGDLIDWNWGNGLAIAKLRRSEFR